MVKLSEHPRALAWDAKQIETLDLIFAGELTNEQIAEQVGMSVSWVKRLKLHPDFRAAIAEKRADFRASIDEVTFADKARRLIALDGAAKIALQELRAHTHLVETRPTRDGPITNESFNEGAMREFRGALDDIAKELGERVSKQQTEVTGKNGGPIELSEVHTQLIARITALRERRATAAIPERTE